MGIYGEALGIKCLASEARESAAERAYITHLRAEEEKAEFWKQARAMLEKNSGGRGMGQEATILGNVVLHIPIKSCFEDVRKFSQEPCLRPVSICCP